MAADLPDQAPDMGRAFFPLGAACRAQQGPDQPPGPVKDHDGLETVLIIIGIEQAQLLVAMHRVEGVADIEHDLPGRPVK